MYGTSCRLDDSLDSGCPACFVSAVFKTTIDEKDTAAAHRILGLWSHRRPSVTEVISHNCGAAGAGKHVLLAVSCGGGLILVLVLSSSWAEVSCWSCQSAGQELRGNST